MSREFNIKFVEFIETFKELYDSNHEGYGNRDVQEYAWHAVAKEMNETVGMCKERWKNIRSAFARHLRYKTISAGSDVTSRRANYYLAKYLAFLVPFTKTKLYEGFTFPAPRMTDIEDAEQTVLLDEESQIKSEFSEEDSTAEIETAISETNSKRKEVDHVYNQLITFTDALQTQDLPVIKKAKTTSQKSRHFQTAEDAVEYFGPKMADTYENSADLNFLKSLLPDMHRMTPIQKHHFKTKVLQIIGDILYDKDSNDLLN